MTCPLCNSGDCHTCDEAGRNFHCANCDLRFLDPKFRVDAVREKARYLEHENDVQSPGLRKFVAPLVDQVQKRLNLGAMGLDFGSGFAPVLQQLFREAGYAIEAYDPFFYPNSELLKRSYDFIVSSEVIEHFFNPAAEFSHLAHMLKKGGWLGLMTHIFDSEKMNFETWYYRKDPTHVVFYSPATLRWIAEEFGLGAPEFFGERVAVMQKL